MLRAFGTILSMVLSLGLVGCGSAVDLKTVGSANASKQAPVTYRPGAKIVVELKDGKTVENHPVSLLDPEQVCAGVIFYNKDGDLIQGTQSCEGSGVGPADSNLKAENIKSGISIGGIEGTLNPSPADCAADGAVNCVAVASFPAADKAGFAASDIRSGRSIAGVSGSLSSTTVACSADGQTNCLANSPYAAANMTGAAAKILFGESLAGVSGSVTLPAVGKVLAGTSFGVLGSSLLGSLVLPAAGNVKTGSGLYGNPTSQITPSYSPDFPSIANVRSIDTVDGAAGTLVTCTAANQSGCVSTSTYKTMDLSAASVMTDLTSSNLNASLASASNFEFWDSSGVRYQASGDLALTSANIVSGATILGVVGNSTASPPSCSSNGQQSCVANGAYAAATACAANGSNCFLPTYVASTQPLKAISYDAINAGKASIRDSLTLSGITGTLTNCGTDGEAGCVVVGPTYAALLKTGANNKILAGNTIGSVTGNVTLPAVTKVLSPTAFGVAGTGSTGTLTLPLDVNVKSGTSAYGEPGSQLTPSYSPDFPSVSNVRSIDTVDGATGTLGDCTAANQSGCVATTTFKTMNLSAAGTNTGLTSANFNATIKAAANFEFWDASGARYSVAGDTDLTTANIASAVNIFGTVGSAVGESHTPCTAANQSNCVATSTYKTMDLSAATVMTDLTSSNLNASLASASNFEFWDSAGARYQANGTTSLSAANILSGTTLFGVAGSATAAPAACSSNGSQSCVATGTYFAATACAANGSNCFLPTYVTSTQPLKAISYDAINAGKASIRDSLTLSGITGTLTNCGTDGEVGCVVVGPTYAALLKTGANNKILAGNTIGSVTGNVTLPAVTKVLSPTAFGVAGTGSTGTLTLPLDVNVKSGTSAYGEPGSQLTPSYSPDFPSVSNVRSIDTVDGATGTLGDCSTNGSSGCVTTATYKSADLTNLSAGNIKRGVSLAGTTGNFPSATSPLPRYSDSGATTNTTGTDITDLTTFISQLTTDGAFEYWSSNGIRMTGSGDSDLIAANIKSPIALENFSLTGTYTGSGNCTGDGQTGCLTTSTYKSVDTSALTVWDIRKGKSAGGIAGSIAFYKNMANTTLFNRTTGTAAAAGLDVYDTIEDNNNNGAFPTQNNTGWEQAGANWTAVLANTAYKDNTTGLVWLKDQGDFTWENAISQCENSTAASRTDWRLPTQKELMQAYADGIWSQKTGLVLTDSYYWSATTISVSTTSAFHVNPTFGDTLASSKANPRAVACVAP